MDTFSFHRIEDVLRETREDEAAGARTLRQALLGGYDARAIECCQEAIDDVRKYRQALETIRDSMKAVLESQESRLVGEAFALLKKKKPISTQLEREMLMLPARARMEVGLRLVQLSVTFLTEGHDWSSAIVEIAELLRRIDESLMYPAPVDYSAGSTTALPSSRRAV